MTEVPVGPTWHVKLPKKVRKALGAKAGDHIRYVIEEGQVRIGVDRGLKKGSFIGEAAIGPTWHVKLPKKVRKELGVKAGDHIRYVIEQDQVRIVPVRPLDRLFGALNYDGAPATPEDMERAIADGASETLSGSVPMLLSGIWQKTMPKKWKVHVTFSKGKVHVTFSKR